MRRRTSDDGGFVSMKRRTASRSCSCSSENAKFMTFPSSSWLAREPEHPLADDVALDLARARVDRLRAAHHEGAVQLVERVLAPRLPPDDETIGTEHVHRDLAEMAVPGAPVELADARLGTEDARLHELGEHPQAVVLHDLDADVRVGELLADGGIRGRAVLVRHVDQIRHLALEGDLLCEERGAALDAA